MSGQNINYRYSEAFKLKVVNELEEGKYRILQASKIYEITPHTIRAWLRKYGKNHLLGKIVRVEMRNEKDKLKQLEKEKQELESALAQAHLKILSLESTLEVAEQTYKIDLKKNSGTVASKKRSKK